MAGLVGDPCAEHETVRRLHAVDAETYADWETIYLDNVQRLDITTIAACHTPVIEGPFIQRAFDRVREFPLVEPPPMPDLADAASRTIAFGKFHGHTLAEIAAFEPSYIDWLAKTIARDPELLAAARVVQEDLDRRSVARRPRPIRV